MSLKAKNIIVILSDQHRWDAMEMYDDRVHTPNLRRMAESGIMFNKKRINY
jgi:arylsulfatase A-like enzyme